MYGNNLTCLMVICKKNNVSNKVCQSKKVSILLLKPTLQKFPFGYNMRSYIRIP